MATKILAVILVRHMRSIGGADDGAKTSRTEPRTRESGVVSIVRNSDMVRSRTGEGKRRSELRPFQCIEDGLECGDCTLEVKRAERPTDWYAPFLLYNTEATSEETLAEKRFAKCLELAAVQDDPVGEALRDQATGLANCTGT